MRVPRFVGRLFAGQVRRADDDRASRRLQREGQARAAVAAGAPELAAGVRGGMTERERLLDELRPVAFAIAYRMLGSVSEAEDVVQEALLRVHQALETGEQIESPHAFAATVTTRLADQRAALRARPSRALRRRVAARADHHRRRGRSSTATRRWPTRSRSRRSCCSRASPRSSARSCCCTTCSTTTIREIAEIVGKSEDNVRQLATRARRHVEQHRPRFQTTREQRDELAAGSSPPPSRATSPGSRRCSPPTCELTGDGGGKVPALARSLYGRNRVGAHADHLGRYAVPASLA